MDTKAFCSLESIDGSFKPDSCRGDACEYIEWDVRNFPGSNIVRSVRLTNTGQRPIAINAEWGNILGGCGVLSRLLIASGRNQTVQFTQAQSILGYCSFSARFQGGEPEEKSRGHEDLSQLKADAESGVCEFALGEEKASGNQVFFYKRGNTATLRMVNRTEEYQRTDYVIEVKVDGQWRLHTEGFSELPPDTIYNQGFHQWGAEDWSAHWQ